MFRLFFLCLLVFSAHPMQRAKASQKIPTQYVSINTAPLQYRSNRSSWQHGQFTVEPLANFHLKARLLSSKHYPSGGNYGLSPVDFVLGWQEMSDSDFLRNVTIKHSHRSYRYRFRFRHQHHNKRQSEKIMRHTVSTRSANMHMIPAKKKIEKKLLSAQADDIISLHGHLVKIQHSNGWKWVSSLTRSDTGKNSCEVVWVERITIEQP